MHRFPPELLDLIGSYLEYFEASEISSHAAKSIVAINIQSVWKAIYRWIGTGNLERIKAAYAEVNFKPSKSLMKAAVEHGKLEINFPESCGSSAMDTAAACGHFSILKYLHKNGSAPCTKGAMNGAAGSGNLGVVRWLHYNRNEGCTKHAMNLAAGNGHLEVVKWLYRNRIEGCTTRALISAIRNDHWHVVEWLFSNLKMSLDVNQVLQFALEDRKLKILSLPDLQTFKISNPTIRFAANRIFTHLAQFMDSLDDSLPNKKLAREYLSGFEIIFKMYFCDNT